MIEKLKQNDKRVITSDPIPLGYVFNGWTGDIQYLDNPSSPSTTVIMPNQNVTVTSNYSMPNAPLFVTSGGKYSADGLVTFKPLNIPAGTYENIAISRDAMHIIIAYFGQTIVRISHNGGASFDTVTTIPCTASSSTFGAVKISDNGQIIIISALMGTGAGLYLSTNGGTSFSLIKSGFLLWGCSMSNSGQYIMCGDLNGQYLSTNYGSSFTTINTGQCTGSNYISYDGSIMMYVKRSTALYRSTNYGSSFSVVSTPLGTDQLDRVFVSNEGSQCILARANSPYNITKSTDRGATWGAITNSGYFSGQGSISNNGNLIGFDNSYSNDGGLTFTYSASIDNSSAFADVVSNVLT